ncbi:hypothetical protein GCM10011374_05020 [Kocuria dechangensis]|uniref:N-acetyltransferase domain-containing protein n=2 Tax=Kocuria dechangensis TaxID=1176249 RepID=A0A917LN64_9MICC|nr:GNAT family N-acetyltransferase [Kocuria dechangensis]GGG45728.1 hypothetical protein GCM10011374_05020 [Kocuria dechangensis]
MMKREPLSAPWTDAVVMRDARLPDVFLLMDLADQAGFQINAQWFRAHLGVNAETEAYLVATLDDAPIAGAMLHLVPAGHPSGPRAARLTALVVDEDHRGGRLGLALLGYCEQRARDMGADTLEICLPTGQHSLDGFWDHHGYERHAAYRHHPPTLWAKTLAAGR